MRIHGTGVARHGGGRLATLLLAAVAAAGAGAAEQTTRADARRAQEQWEAREVGLEIVGSREVSALVANSSKKLRLVNVWATWCGPCAVEFPELVELQRSYGHRGFELVSISADDPDNRPAVHEFLREKHAATANYLFDSDDQYALIEAVDESWQGALPYSMLIAAGGEVLYRHQGSLDMLELKREIVKVLGREKDW